VSISVSPIVCPDGRIVGASTIARDISARKQAEKDLLIKNSALGFAANGIALADPDGKIFYANSAFLRLWGYSGENQVYGRAFQRCAHGDADSEEILNHIGWGLRQQGIWLGELRATRCDGGRFDLAVHASAIPGKDGKILCLMLYCIDISDRKRVEQDLRITQDRLRDVIEFLPDPTFIIDTENTVIAWNRAIEEMTHVTREQILGKGDYRYAFPFYGENRPVLIDMVGKPREEVLRSYPNARFQGPNIHTEAFAPEIGNGGMHLWAKASPLLDPLGNRIGAIETIRDISDWKKAEGSLRRAHAKIETELQEKSVTLVRENIALREEADRLHASLQGAAFAERAFLSLRDPVFMLDTQARIVQANETAAKVVSIDNPSLLSGRSFISLIDPEQGTEAIAILVRARDTFSGEGEIRLQSAGNLTRMSVRISKVTGDSGTPLGFLVLCTRPG
jgi:PAS domain S-box-containing protein